MLARDTMVIPSKSEPRAGNRECSYPPSTETAVMKKLSVIIPTRGRNSLVERALAHLAALDFDLRELEAVVVDNNDDPEASALLAEICAQAPPFVRYVQEPSPGLTAARHRGAESSNSDLLAFIDDDALVSPGWATAIVTAFQRSATSMVCGPSIPLFSGSIPAWLWGFFQHAPGDGWHCGWLSLLDLGSDREDIDPAWVWGLNFNIRKDTLMQLGGFHPDLVPGHLQRWQGDGETGLSLKAKQSDIRADYVQSALVHHVIGEDRLTPEYFEQRAFYQGVCDSFTRIRAGADPIADPADPRPEPGDPGGHPLAAATCRVRKRTVRAYNDGWRFHQREAAADASLVQWIRRAHFLDADIRDQLAATGDSRP